MQISIQTNNHKCRISVAIKQSALCKKRVKSGNTELDILCKIAFIFYKMPTLLSSEVNKAILEQVKVAE